VRRKQSYACETFLRHEDARKWAIATERRIDLGEAPRKAVARDPTLFAHLVDLHALHDAACRAAGETPDRRLDRVLPLMFELYRRLRPHPVWRDIEHSIRGGGAVRRILEAPSR
jgi:hypothetical protein